MSHFVPGVKPSNNRAAVLSTGVLEERTIRVDNAGTRSAMAGYPRVADNTLGLFYSWHADNYWAILAQRKMHIYEYIITRS